MAVMPQIQQSNFSEKFSRIGSSLKDLANAPLETYSTVKKIQTMDLQNKLDQERAAREAEQAPIHNNYLKQQAEQMRMAIEEAKTVPEARKIAIADAVKNFTTIANSPEAIARMSRAYEMAPDKEKLNLVQASFMMQELMTRDAKETTGGDPEFTTVLDVGVPANLGELNTRITAQKEHYNQGINKFFAKNLGTKLEQYVNDNYSKLAALDSKDVVASFVKDKKVRVDANQLEWLVPQAEKLFSTRKEKIDQDQANAMQQNKGQTNLSKFGKLAADLSNQYADNARSAKSAADRTEGIIRQRAAEALFPLAGKEGYTDDQVVPLFDEKFKSPDFRKQVMSEIISAAKTRNETTDAEMDELIHSLDPNNLFGFKNKKEFYDYIKEYPPPSTPSRGIAEILFSPFKEKAPAPAVRTVAPPVSGGKSKYSRTPAVSPADFNVPE